MSKELSQSIGVIVVAFDSADVIEECVKSLLDSDYPKLRIVIVDNDSTDGTLDILSSMRDEVGEIPFLTKDHMLDEELPDQRIICIRAGVNLGYAGGVNVGLRFLKEMPDIDLFWILNPDCRVFPETARRFVEHAESEGSFGLMSGRVILMSPENMIQSDGGCINRLTGMASNLHSRLDARNTSYPTPDQFDYVCGASLVASREFVDKVGLMEEDYFLYYEEIDWGLRRGPLSLTFANGADVLHYGGTAAGSSKIGNEHGSSFANYFNYRNRLRFMRRFFPLSLPLVFLYSFAKVLRLVSHGRFSEADGALRGLIGLYPPKSVRDRLSPEAYRLASK